MRYEKEIYIPAKAIKEEHVEPLRLKNGQAASFSDLRFHDGLAAGEGSADVRALTASAAKLFTAEGGVYVYESGTKSLYSVLGGVRTGGIAGEPTALLSHVTETGTVGLYCVEKNAVRYISGGTVKHSDSVGGDCAAVHHGRLFVGNGTRLYFSAPYSTEGITQTERSPDKGCYVDFDGEMGNIFSLVSHAEKLYVFFEHGLLRVNASGEAIDLKAVKLPFAGGELLQGSAAACGDRICYMTPHGLYSLRGESFTQLDRQNFTAARGYRYKNGYAAEVTLQSGEKAVYVFDFTEKAGRLLHIGGLLSAEGEYCLAGTSVFRLAEGGTPLSGGKPTLTLTLTASPRSLAWVRVDGYGEFEIGTNASREVRSAKGDETAFFHGKPLSETQIQIAAKDTAFRILAVDVGWRMYGDRYH